MSSRLCLLLLLLASYTASSPVGDPVTPNTPLVRIPIYGLQYVKLHVGDPGRTRTLRLRHDLNESYLYELQPEDFSDTFTDPPDQSEIFYFSNVYVRLRVVYGWERFEPDRRLATAGTVKYHGSLGLGLGSDVWKHWTSFTRSKYTLTLGGTIDTLDIHGTVIDYDLQQTDIFPITPECGLSAGLEASAGSVQTYPPLSFPPLASIIYPLQLRPFEDYTYLPAALYTALQNKPDMTMHMHIARIDRLAPQCPVPDPTLVSPSAMATGNFPPSIELKISPRTSIVPTPFHSQESLLRISETDVTTPTNGIAIGILTLVYDSVLHIDYVLQQAVVGRGFYTYPRMGNDVVTLLPLIIILVWLWMVFETHPMLSQWTKELLFRLRDALPVQQRRTTRIDARRRQLISGNAHYDNGIRKRRPIGDVLSAESGMVYMLGQMDGERQAAMTAAAVAVAGGDRTSQQQQQQPRPLLRNSSNSGAKNYNDRIAFRKRFLELYSAFDQRTVEVLLHIVRIIVFFSVYMLVFGFDASRFLERTMRSIDIPSSVGAIFFYISIVLVVLLSALVNQEFLRRYPSAGVMALEFTLLLCAWLWTLIDRDTNLLDQLTSVVILTVAAIRLVEWIVWIQLRGPDWVAEPMPKLTKDIESNSPLSQPVAPRLVGERALLGYVWVLFLVPFSWLLLALGNVMPFFEFLWPTSPVLIVSTIFYVIVAVIFIAYANVINIYLQLYYSILERLVQEWERAKTRIREATTDDDDGDDDTKLKA